MIKQLHLKNFKCFESQMIGLNNLTVLTGLNGMGKSSVLQALLVLRQSFLKNLLPTTGLGLNGDFVQMGTAKDVLYEYAHEDELEIGITWDDAFTAKFVLRYVPEADVLRIISSDMGDEVFKRMPFNDLHHYLRAERLGPRTVNEVSDYEVRQHRQIGPAGEYTEHFLQMYGTDKIKYSQLLRSHTIPNDLQSQVQAWLSEISPGTTIHLEMYPKLDRVTLQYSFLTGEQRSNPYRATSVGFGITYALPIIVAILSSKIGGIVLLENPEAHIHPRGQSIIGELMGRAARAGIQIIVETHSDHILNGIRVAIREGIVDPADVAIHYFTRMEEKGRVYCKIETPNVDKDGRLDIWPEGFFDEWDKNLERLITPRDS